MKTFVLFLCFFCLLSCGRSQDLAGEYFVTGQGGEIVLKIQYTQGNQLQGMLTDMQGNAYQVQATEEDGEAFGQLINPQGGMYFEAMREGSDLYLTLIPAGADGQPNAAGSQEFVMKARSSGSATSMAGVLSGQSSSMSGAPGASQDAGAKGWSGTYSGNFNGTPTTMTIQPNGNQLQGEVDAGGYRYTLSGSISGNESEGRFVDPQTRGTLNYNATLNGDQLALTIENPANGQSSRLQFTRGSRGAASLAGDGSNVNTNGGQQFERDGRLAGGWSYTDSYTSGEYGFAAQWKLIINPDGSYLYGDGRVVGGGPGVSGDSGSGGDVTRGQWRTENGIIYLNEGYGWQPYCRYTTNGQSLLMQFGDGSKQLWKRTH